MADEITLTLEPPYIGSAYSPQVTVEEIEGGHSVTITSDVPGEGIVPTTFDVMDGDASQAIEDAEAAAAAARAAASSASSAATSATNAAGAASTAAGQASTAASAATDAASAATGAAASASAAAADATEAAGLAGDATAAATAAASNAGTATRDAITATTGANNAAATANAAAGSAAIAAADATTAAGTATDAATSATTAASAAGTAADAANTAATAANAAAEAATEAAEGITDAWLPRVTVGASEGITGGGPLDTAAWTERACPGSDGPARVESIHGRSVVWNQLLQNGNFESATGWYGDNATFSVADGVLSMSPSESGRQVYGVRSSLNLSGGAQVVGHKYLAIADVKVSRACGILMQRYNTGAYIQVTAINSWVRIADIYALSVVASGYMVRLNARLGSGTFDTTDVVQAKNYQIFDLTAIFGAGNEPSTVAEFEAMYPDAYYPYDAGSLQPVQLTGVESAGDGWTFQRAIDTGVLRGAGSVYDELTADEHITRVGEVDLGTLNWNMTGDAAPFFIATPSDYQTVSVGECTISCARYEVLNAMKRADFDVADNDKKIAQITNIGASARIGIMDTAYTDAASFKAAMSGVMLHYAIATPTVTTIDPALNLTYKAAAGGTERILHDEPTAPPTLVIQYGSTADGIRDRALEAIAAHDGPIAQTYHAVGTYLTLNGTLYRVTTAIAAGERITAGTNVVATTVMAEVLALTQ